jgi:LPXTG-motif cell wall-anchored protein
MKIKKLFRFFIAFLIILTLIPTAVADNGRATPMISAGWEHFLALKDDGTLWIWGMYSEGNIAGNIPKPMMILDDVIFADAGKSHSLAITSDGSLWSWGNNWYGQLGYEDYFRSSTSVPGKVMDGVIYASAGDWISYAIKSDGSLWGWGFGILGDGTVAESYPPSEVNLPRKIMDDVIAVSAGFAGHTLALKSDGTLWAWGTNGGGQVGDGTMSHVIVEENIGVWVQNYVVEPIKIMDNIKSIEAGWGEGGGGFSLALRNDGSLWGWGSNYQGQLGLGYSEAVVLAPTKIMDDVSSFSASYNHCFAIKTDGGLWVWGNHASGLTEDGQGMHLSPVRMTIDGVFAASAGLRGNIVIKNDGNLWGWGAEDMHWFADGEPVIWDWMTPGLIMEGMMLPFEIIEDMTPPAEIAAPKTGDATAVFVLAAIAVLTGAAVLYRKKED